MLFILNHCCLALNNAVIAPLDRAIQMKRRIIYLKNLDSRLYESPEVNRFRGNDNQNEKMHVLCNKNGSGDHGQVYSFHENTMHEENPVRV